MSQIKKAYIKKGIKKFKLNEYFLGELYEERYFWWWNRELLYYWSAKEWHPDQNQEKKEAAVRNIILCGIRRLKIFLYNIIGSVQGHNQGIWDSKRSKQEIDLWFRQ